MADEVDFEPRGCWPAVAAALERPRHAEVRRAAENGGAQFVRYGPFANGKVILPGINFTIAPEHRGSLEEMLNAEGGWTET
jgi:hypothetical protein